MTKEIKKKEENEIVKYDDEFFVDDILKRALATKIVTPADYSMENAVKSAYLHLEEKNYFSTCTKTSIINAVMDMIVQGLNISKDQGYFIKYNSILKFSRSYMGSIAVLKRFNKAVENVHSEVIYEGDDVEYDIVNGMKCNIKHRQSISNIDKNKIIGVYSVVLNADNEEIESDLMTFDEVLKSWERSQKTSEVTKPVINGKMNPNSDHGKHPARFCRRTMINRICKMMISATDDKELLRAVRQSDEDTPIIEIVQQEIDQNANQKLIDFNQAKDSGSNKRNMIEVKKDNSVKVGQPEITIATKEQARTITRLSIQLGQKEKMMGEISGYFNKEIAKISELTFDEAADYINILNEQIKDIPQDEKPEWA